MLLLAPPPDSTINLHGVTVHAKSERTMQQTQNISEVRASYLEEHPASTLMQSLATLPGIQAMTIGSGLSRPAIRGMGFNRMVVAHDGIKHEGQQWGDDHGLEIDQSSVGRIEVIKGPAALLYGSDAIGGVLNITSATIPRVPFEGEVCLTGHSNNASGGLSSHFGGRKGGFFYRAGLNLTDYADYRVPTDTIYYYSYAIRLHDGCMRNTAGNERDLHLLMGYTNDRNLRTDLSISNVYSRSGFFADAHGLEVRLSDINYDASRRDIDLPYQWVSHTKVQSHTIWQIEHGHLDINLAWQHNQREEMSEPFSHGYMPKPPDSLERGLDRHTLTANADLLLHLPHRNDLHAGLNSEYSNNSRYGWGFIIPAYSMMSGGVYLTDNYRHSSHLTLSGGLRYDAATIDIDPYTDWFATDGIYRQRAYSLHRSFNNLTWSAGANWHKNGWMLRLNLGKAFRTPIAKELSCDGVNYHRFTYEQGNADLMPERSYQLDAGVQWSGGRWTIKADPFFNYFPNYIYLNPTDHYSEGMQLYQYTQCEALRWGLEADAEWLMAQHWLLSLKGEYCYARQLSGDKAGYTLPFSVPAAADIDLLYRFNTHSHDGITLNLHLVARQNDIVPPEKPTPGYTTINISACKHYTLRSGKLSLVLSVSNLLNQRYFDHTSFYRLIDVPEPGRNISLKINYSFKKSNKE